MISFSDRMEPVDPTKIKPAPSWLGRRVGRFKLLALIGQGAMGRVFRAEDATLNRQVALKILPATIHFGDRTLTVEQFIREARSAASLEHPNVVQIYEVNEMDKIWYIAMELLEGGNLRELVKANGPMDSVRACQLVAEAAEALDYAHRAGIIHRDIKPSNLMLTRTGRCKVTDFGLARIHDANDGFDLGVEAVGTPHYMAPEVARGFPATAASDVYSLGCTLYYLLTGRNPFFAPSLVNVVKMHASDPQPDACEARPDLPPTLSQAIQKAMAKKPKDRFESAEQFAKVLRVHTIPLSGSTGSGVVMSVSDTLASAGLSFSTPAKKNRLPLMIGGGTAAVCALAVAIYFGLHHDSQPPLVATATVPLLATTPPPTPPVIESHAQVPAPPAPNIIAPTPQPNLPVTFEATETRRLQQIAFGHDAELSGHSVIVSGTIASVHPTTAGKNMHIEFVGVDNEIGFVVTATPEMTKKIQSQFAGTGDASLVGEKIRVTGVLTDHKGRPEMRIDSLNQIERVK
jgi:serine/threonine protein kinase